MDDNKYRLFRNFMYNDLGISKEDIRDWVRETVLEVATTYVRDQMSNKDLDRRITEILAEPSRGFGFGSPKKDVERSIKNEIASLVASKFDIVLNVKGTDD